MTIPDLSHLHALQFRLHNETMRLNASTGRERIQRQVWVDSCKKEITAEYKFLGLPEPAPQPEMTLDQIFNELDDLGLN